VSIEQTRAVLTAIRHTADRQLKQIDGLLAMLDEEPELEHAPTLPEGCQHTNIVSTSTLGNPGRKLCVDCNQMIP
jgi:hypothetical protein